jgi:hypothetical protein
MHAQYIFIMSRWVVPIGILEVSSNLTLQGSFGIYDSEARLLISAEQTAVF